MYSGHNSNNTFHFPQSTYRVFIASAHYSHFRTDPSLFSHFPTASMASVCYHWPSFSFSSTLRLSSFAECGASLIPSLNANALSPRRLHSFCTYETAVARTAFIAAFQSGSSFGAHRKRSAQTNKRRKERNRYRFASNTAQRKCHHHQPALPAPYTLLHTPMRVIVPSRRWADTTKGSPQKDYHLLAHPLRLPPLLCLQHPFLAAEGPLQGTAPMVRGVTIPPPQLLRGRSVVASLVLGNESGSDRGIRSYRFYIQRALTSAMRRALSLSRGPQSNNSRPPPLRRCAVPLQQ